MIPLHVPLLWTLVPLVIAVVITLVAVRLLGPGALWPAVAITLLIVLGATAVAFWRPPPGSRLTSGLFLTVLYAIPLAIALRRYSRGTPAPSTWPAIALAGLKTAGIAIPWSLLVGLTWFVLQIFSGGAQP
jgi:hypothetical protein